jgi:hypothetical protein
MSLFSQLLRPFFRHFAKEAVKSLKPFFRKESFTKETIILAKRWKSVYKIFKNSFINNLLETV